MRAALSALVFALSTLTACGGAEAPTEAPEARVEAKQPERPAKAAKAKVAKARAAVEASESPEVEPVPEHLQVLMDPASLHETAPAEFKVSIETTSGTFVILVHRAWSPNGADRFYTLVKHGFYDDTAFFRVLDGFVAQFGIHGDPRVAKKWRDAKIDDDPAGESNTRGRIVFATAGPNTRTTQLFINFRDNANLDSMGFTPFGEVVEGLDVVDGLYKGYGEGAPRGKGPNQGLMQKQGNSYLEANYPKLDYVKSAKVL